MNLKTENSARGYWNRLWARFLKHHGMIAPSGKLIQQMIPFVPRNGLLLDLGCGEGRNTIYLSRIGFRAIGLDLSPQAIAVLSNNLFEEEVRAFSIVGDARALPFPDGCFDGILGHHIFDHLDADGFRVSLDEARRVLKPGGILLCTMDTFQKGMSDPQAVHCDDGTLVFTGGSKKGMVARPYNETELQALPAGGWEIRKNELTPQRSKIMLLSKLPDPPKPA